MISITFMLLFAIFGIIVSIVLFRLNKKNKLTGAFAGVSFFYILYFSFIPVLMYFYKDEFVGHNIKLLKLYYEKDFYTFFITFVLICISYFAFFIAYFKTKRIIKKNYSFSINRNYKFIRNIAIISFIIGTTSLILYIYSFGGLGQAITSSEYVRSFSGNTSKLTSFNSAPLILSSLFVTLCPFLFGYLGSDFTISKIKQIKYRILFVCSFVFSIIYFLINAGRMELLVYILSFIYPLFAKKLMHPWICIIILGGLSLPILDILDNLSLFFQSGQFDTIEIDYIKYFTQFTYPIKNIMNVVDIVCEYGYRFGYDLLCVFNIIPGIYITPSYEIVSEFFSGVNWAVVGGTPSDFVTFSYMQFNFIGVIFFSYIYGWACSKIDQLTRIWKTNITYSKLTIYTYIMFGSFMIMLDGDISTLIRGKYVFIILFIVVLKSLENKN